MLTRHRHLAQTGKVLSWTVDALDTYEDSTHAATVKGTIPQECYAYSKSSIGFSCRIALSIPQWHKFEPLLKRGSEPRFERYRKSVGEKI